MDSSIIVTKNLVKRYGKTVALDNLNLEIKKGKIYGFIGQNGAGKTTFIRLIVGLSFPTSGEITLFGQKGKQALQLQRKKIGCLVETPALYMNMTAKQNMEIQQIQRGINDKKSISEILNLVGLSATDKKKVRNYSLGMRQRLGIGIALINEPELLILDEPINGLDPMGIIEIRNLLKRLNEERKITIIISSHILSELHQVASEYILVDKGRIIEQLTMEQLNEKCKSHLILRINNTDKAAAALKIHLNTDNFIITSDGAIKLYDHLEDKELISAVFSKEDVLITEMTVSSDNLENYFLKKIERNE